MSYGMPAISEEESVLPNSWPAFKPLIGVYGNCDGQEIRLEYPESKFIEAEGLRVLLKHIGGSPGHYDKDARVLLDAYHPDVFVCGHSHILKVMNDRQRNLLYINPGAAGIQGWHVVRTALRVKLDAGRLHDMEVFQLPRARKTDYFLLKIRSSPCLLLKSNRVSLEIRGSCSQWRGRLSDGLKGLCDPFLNSAPCLRKSGCD